MKPYLFHMYIVFPLPCHVFGPKHGIHTLFMYILDGTTSATNHTCFKVDLDSF